MRLPPSAVTGLALLVAVLLAWSPRLRAQEQQPPVRPATGQSTVTGVDAGTQAAVLRTRGVSAWRNYVWSLERDRLRYSLSELIGAHELETGEPDVSELYLIAFGALIMGDEEYGRSAAAQVRERVPKFEPNLLLAAFEAILAGEPQAALDRLDEFVDVIERAPRDPVFGAEFRFLAYMHRGAQRHDIGAFDGAVSDLKIAIRIARDEGRVPATSLVLRLARTHQSLNEHGAAAELVRELLRRDPANADLYHNMGLLEGSQQHAQEARVWYERALARRRSYMESELKLAFLAWRDADADPEWLRATRRHLAACEELVRDKRSQSLHADTESGLGAYWLTVARHRSDQGDRASARQAFLTALRHFETALQHDANCVRALNSIVQMGAELDWPPERVAPYLERLNAIQSGDEDAPTGHRGSFC